MSPKPKTSATNFTNTVYRRHRFAFRPVCPTLSVHHLELTTSCGSARSRVARDAYTSLIVRKSRRRLNSLPGAGMIDNSLVLNFLGTILSFIFPLWPLVVAAQLQWRRHSLANMCI